MSNFVFANNVNTTLASGISSSATTMTLSSSANLPSSIPAGEFFVLTLNDVATRGVFEIVYATAVSGATVTIVRAQEGTAALAWLAGDYIYSGVTAGQMRSVSSGRLINIQKITSSQTYNETPGTKAVYVKIVAGGGSGGGAAATTSAQAAAAAGGGSGAYAEAYLTSGFSGGIAVTIGAAAPAAAAGANAGNVGGASSFGSLISCPGGTAGGPGMAVIPPKGGGSNGTNSAAPTGGNILNLAGQAGGNGLVISVDNPTAGYGGSNPLGIGGWSPTGNGARPASGYGSGSSGANAQNSSAAQPSVDAEPGVCIVYEYA